MRFARVLSWLWGVWSTAILVWRAANEDYLAVIVGLLFVAGGYVVDRMKRLDGPTWCLAAGFALYAAGWCLGYVFEATVALLAGDPMHPIGFEALLFGLLLLLFIILLSELREKMGGGHGAPQ
jgi:hypothetical protein